MLSRAQRQHSVLVRLFRSTGVEAAHLNSRISHKGLHLSTTSIKLEDPFSKNDGFTAKITAPWKKEEPKSRSSRSSSSSYSSSYQNKASKTFYSERKSGTSLKTRQKIQPSLSLGSVYHSKYYIPLPGEVRDFLHRVALPSRAGTSSIETLIKCPSCNSRSSNTQHSLRINNISGKFDCVECNTQGGWIDFIRMFKGPESDVVSAPEVTVKKETVKQPVKKESEKLSKDVEVFQNSLYATENIKQWLMGTEEDGLGFSKDTLDKYMVGYAQRAHGNLKDMQQKEEDAVACLVFPKTGSKNKITDLKSIPVDEGSHTLNILETGYLHYHDAAPGLFGLHIAKDNEKTVILTNNELDAMAAYQSTGIPALSLPKGNTQLPIEVLPLLERFEKVYVWLDEYDANHTLSKKFAHKLGLGRTWLIPCQIELSDGMAMNALQAMKAGVDFNQVLTKAKRVNHRQITGFNDLRESVFNELTNPDQVRGIQSLEFPTLTKVIKGHRAGELTILTGSTGVGKTTILSQLSLDYCQQGVSTLWGSFEISNVRLARKMLHQFSGKDLTQCSIEEMKEYAAQFEYVRFPL